jgi:hypothetical protein
MAILGLVVSCSLAVGFLPAIILAPHLQAAETMDKEGRAEAVIESVASVGGEDVITTLLKSAKSADELQSLRGSCQNMGSSFCRKAPKIVPRRGGCEPCNSRN